MDFDDYIRAIRRTLEETMNDELSNLESNTKEYNDTKAYYENLIYALNYLETLQEIKDFIDNNNIQIDYETYQSLQGDIAYLENDYSL